ncbi:MAG: fumarylacetoacetate hydrolase family protein [Sphingomonadaceae bacterium]|uniref:fumarylacetoacetate hydrolase family protein n=1 Tax=Thermaurantiacus sp. TaxID=2820283 RepID=UPI00298F2807|nr:fumarylacetoacetate hydrolase family protein [Thermaurantiacus sp.]MCS6986691.1 fumarylacetoacetate hydrolase family protein [Sphingomonadaceae bacterium]MDW8414046.1 fumarylacetoacetate hydrolase family protein [Thermaurantiacus sp.]
MSWFPPPEARIFCVAVNYADHRDEMGRGESGQYPMLFLRTPRSLVPGGAPVVKPKVSDRFDYEGELAVVIGTAGRRIPPAQALDHVAGFTAFMDGSVRDWQRHTAQFTPGKNFDRSGSIGPDLVAPHAFGDWRGHELITRVNGQVVQQTHTSLMLVGIEALIAYVSAFTELRPGDVIATGTCAGVGEKRQPPLFLFPGDVVEVAISGLPVLRSPVVAEA